MNKRVFSVVAAVLAAAVPALAQGANLDVQVYAANGGTGVSNVALYGEGNLQSITSATGPGSYAETNVVGRSGCGGWVNGRFVTNAVCGAAINNATIEAYGPGAVAGVQGVSNAYWGRSTTVTRAGAYGNAQVDIANAALAQGGAAYSGVVGTAEGCYGGAGRTYVESIADAVNGAAYNNVSVGSRGFCGGCAVSRAAIVNQGFGWPSTANVNVQAQAFNGAYGQAQAVYFPQ